MREQILLKTDKLTVSLEATKDGKIRANASAWAEPVVILADEKLEVRWALGQVNLVRCDKAKKRPRNAVTPSGDAPVTPLP